MRQLVGACAWGLVTIGAGVLVGPEAGIVAIVVGLSLGLVLFADSRIGHQFWRRHKMMIAGLTFSCALIGLVGGLVITYWRPSEAERQLRRQLGQFITTGETARTNFREEVALLLQGHVNMQLVDVRRRQIEMWREDVGALLESRDAQNILRPEITNVVMTEAGDRISESITRLRDVLNNWNNWKR